jgi:phosphate/sulfate permease
MGWIVVVILLVVIVVFGSVSGAQSYAIAQQAQATIEVAKIGQINAWGNLVTILAFLVILTVILALIAAVLYFRIQQGKSRKPKMIDASDQPQSLSPGRSMEMLMQMMLMEMLDSRRGQRQGNLLEAPGEEPDDPFPWLR